MAKDIKDYTPEELQKIGYKTVLQRINARVRDSERSKVSRQLYNLFKAGKIQLPK